MIDSLGRFVAISAERYSRVVRRAIFDACRYHVQHGDTPTLAPFAFLLTAPAWGELCRLAEALAREAADAERELLSRPELHAALGLSPTLRRALAAAATCPTPGPVRFQRFDFHLTSEGLRITEGNPDVCGGFIEASGVAPLVADAIGVGAPLGDPAGTLARAIRAATRADARVGLMHASMFTDDRQTALYVARRLREMGLDPCPFDAASIRGRDKVLFAGEPSERAALDLIFRFYPADWLPRLGPESGWPLFYAQGKTRLSNPGWAALTQSKRFPLVWSELDTSLSTWRRLLPDTRSPDDTPLDDDWVVKPAFGHEGDRIAIAGVGSKRRREALRARARARPHAWALQRRFASLPVETPGGPRHVCIGVFVIDGRAAGAYARAAEKALIDARAQDVVVLGEEGR